jgi:hypothetical protein
VKLHAIFLRDGCTLPDKFILRQERFCLDWMLVEGFAALTLDAKIRTAGWHFMWMVGSSVRRGCGRTREGAFHHALERALKITPSQFNSSELNSYEVKRYIGFYMARVTLQPRQIQQQTTLHIALA